MPSVRHWEMRRISPASHPKNTSRFCDAEGHTPATLACLPRHKLLSDRIERQQKLLPPQLISTSNPVFFSPTLWILSLNAVLATLESCQLLKFYLASNYLYLALYSKCADLKNTTFFHSHTVVLPSAGFTPAIVKSCSARGVSLLTKHFKYTVAETAMSRPVGIFAVYFCTTTGVKKFVFELLLKILLSFITNNQETIR